MATFTRKVGISRWGGTIQEIADAVSEIRSLVEDLRGEDSLPVWVSVSRPGRDDKYEDLAQFVADETEDLAAVSSVAVHVPPSLFEDPVNVDIRFARGALVGGVELTVSGSSEARVEGLLVACRRVLRRRRRWAANLSWLEFPVLVALPLAPLLSGIQWWFDSAGGGGPPWTLLAIAGTLWVVALSLQILFFAVPRLEIRPPGRPTRLARVLGGAVERALLAAYGAAVAAGVVFLLHKAF